MAKVCHSKEIIGCKLENAVGKTMARPGRNEIKTKPAFKCSSATQFLDELMLWKAALQIETFASGQ
jgi:hypothetical protein